MLGHASQSIKSVFKFITEPRKTILKKLDKCDARDFAKVKKDLKDLADDLGLDVPFFMPVLYNSVEICLACGMETTILIHLTHNDSVPACKKCFDELMRRHGVLRN
jgi:hypothetical protein